MIDMEASDKEKTMKRNEIAIQSRKGGGAMANAVDESRLGKVEKLVVVESF